MMKTIVFSIVLLAGIVATMTVVVAEQIHGPVPILLDPRTQPVSHEVFGAAQATDTFYYGGTVWDPVDSQWEAAEPAFAGWANRNAWTWSSTGYNGVAHSGLYLDGWTGVDFTATLPGNYFRVMDDATLTPPSGVCIIDGSKSLWCGATTPECVQLRYADKRGSGYGNGWNYAVRTPSYDYSDGDEITLRYDYKVEVHLTDQAVVYVQAYVSGQWQPDLTQVSWPWHSGNYSGGEVIDLDSYLPSDATKFRIYFHFNSNSYASDQDGMFGSWCGACGFDNYRLEGDVTDSENFENVAVGGLPSGWSTASIPACGTYVFAAHTADLTTPINLDPCVTAIPGNCSMGDTVICMFDQGEPAYPHPLCQNNLAMSPVIDLTGHPGIPGRVLVSEVFADLEFSDHVFMYWKIRYWPYSHPDSSSPWLSDDFVYYTDGGPTCYTWINDVSGYVPPSAEKVQVGLGVVNYCDEEPWGMSCSYECNETPYFDNVSFGIFGSDEAPYIAMRELDYWQDQFAEDGTLNPTSTADTRTPNNIMGSYDTTPPIFGDTLVCRGAADNMRCDFVFRMPTVGPQQPVTHPFFTTRFPTVTTGAWQSARMDTAEVASPDGSYRNVIPEWWMCTFHESDPVAIANGLPELTEILPNNLFVPGTRIEYFVKSAYVATPGLVFTIPDTTGGTFEEFEILPMMRDDGMGSVEWPCLIVVDHFGQRGNWFERNSDRIERHLAILGYDYDMFNKLAPSADQRNGIGRWPVNPGQIGGPGTDKYNWGPGATLAQFVGYKHCILNAGNIFHHSIEEPDVDIFTPWLTEFTGPEYQRTMWISGDHICRALSIWVPWGPPFLTNVLCATYVSWSYSDVYMDFTYCLPMNGLAGNIACTPKDWYLRMNGCPRKYNEIGLSGAAGCSAVAEVEYDSQGPVTLDIANDNGPALAGVSNSVFVPSGSNYKTYTEGYDFCVIRDDDSLWPTSRNCGPDNFIATWMNCVLSWFGCVTSICGPSTVIDVSESRIVNTPFTTSLSQAFPNPMNPIARIQYSIGTPGKVALRIFDVSGRVVKTLVDNTKSTGEYSVAWDGTNDHGRQVGGGVFFYQLEAPGYRSAKKIVILP